MNERSYALGVPDDRHSGRSGRHLRAESVGRVHAALAVGHRRLGYGAAFYFLSLTLRTIPVGVAYAVWSGIGIVLISLIGWIVYRQSLDVPTIIGIALILAGVVVINLLSKSVPR